MALPSTQWLKKYDQAKALNKGSGDLPDWDSDGVAFIPYGNSFDATAYNADTNTGYGVSPWTAANKEALTVSGQYTQGAGFPLATRTVTIASGKVLYTCSADLQISAATLGVSNLTLTYASPDTGFQGGIIAHISGPTTKWILGVYNFGAPVPIIDPNTATIHWATTPAAGTVFHWE